MTRLLLDQGLPRSTMLHLKKAGWDVVHVYDIDLSRASDRRIFEHAHADGRTVVTLDADFHALLAVENSSDPSVIRIRKEGRMVQIFERAVRYCYQTNITGICSCKDYRPTTFSSLGNRADRLA